MVSESRLNTPRLVTDADRGAIEGSAPTAEVDNSESLPQARISVPAPARLEHPLHRIAAELVTRAEELANETIHEEPQLGFGQAGGTAISTKALSAELSSASRQIGMLVRAELNLGDVGIIFRNLAVSLQTVVDAYRYTLADLSVGGKVSELRRVDLFESTINFRAKLVNELQEIDGVMNKLLSGSGGEAA